jgi:tetratricopeptide (TPR) repeat protein
MANEDYQGARQQYAKLGKAPAPFYKARSAFLTGRSLQAEKKYQEATDAFDLALKTTGGSKPQQLKATLHRAVCKAALGDAPESTEAIKQIIKQAEVKNTQLLAEAYNALGDCYLLADDKKAARHAFLHVDLLFSSAVTEHAKALYELSQLWEEQGQPTRAQDAQDRLQEKYPSSHWAKR